MITAVLTYILWGILPVYWKLISVVPAHEILAHRIFWSFVFMALLVCLTKKTAAIVSECRQIINSPKQRLSVVSGALLICINWFIYIWAVNDNRIIETSLGYYINPLVSVLIGIMILQEKLSFWQSVSVLLAAAGVMNMTLQFGSIPWVALLLALTSGFYGLCKKVSALPPITSMTLETLLTAPFALIYLLYLQAAGLNSAFTPQTVGLLAATGIVTVIPLLLFAYSANKLPLSVLGLFQYLMPTIGLLIGVFLYQESFTRVHLVSFSFIWLGLLVFSLAKTAWFTQLETLILKKCS
jgi:chloramphenicol-sensitive protein RarD